LEYAIAFISRREVGLWRSSCPVAYSRCSVVGFQTPWLDWRTKIL